MQVCFKEGLPSGFGASPFWLDRHKDSIDLREHIWIVGLQNPTPVALAIHVEDAETDRLLGRAVQFPPGLKSLRLVIPRLGFQIESIEEQRPSLGIKHSPI